MSAFAKKLRAIFCCEKKQKADGDLEEVMGGQAEPEPSEFHRNFVAAEKRNRAFFPWLPFMLLLCIANTEPYAACWTAFAFAVLFTLNDFLQARLSGASFPTTLNFTSLVVYVLLIVVVNQNPNFNPKFIGPIALTFLTAAVFFSMVFSRPLTAETTSQLVEEPMRSSSEFLKFNQFLTAYVLIWFSIMLIVIWVGTMGDLDSALQVVCGIVVPVLVPVLIHLTIPTVAHALKSYAGTNADEEDREGLLDNENGNSKEDEEDEAADLGNDDGGHHHALAKDLDLEKQ